MLWLLLILIVLGTTLAKATLQADLRSFGATDLQIRLSICGVRKTWRYQLSRTQQGRQLTRTDTHGTKAVDPSQLRHSRGSVISGIFRRADKARHFLLSHIHLECLEGLILLRTEDAAVSVLLSGTMQGVLSCIPAIHRSNVCIRVLPEFFRAHSTVNARCIIRFRLGTIILTAGMLLAAYIRQQRPTESEAIEYGTSYR